MALVYNCGTNLTLNNVDATMNAESAGTISAGDVELSFAGVGNFLQGNYIQKSDDVQNIESHVKTIQAGFGRMRLFLLSNTNKGADESAYGTSLKSAGFVTEFGAAAVNRIETEDVLNDGNINVNSVIDSSLGSVIALPNYDESAPITSKRLLKDMASLGDGLVNAVGAALFKKVGKNAALINENSMRTAINNNFHTSLGAVMNESGKDYANSQYFKRYLASGRYATSGSQDINTAQDYVMNNTVVKCKLSMLGTVRDADSSIDLSTSSNIDTVFGSGGSHTASGDPTHLINSTGTYKINVYLELRHDERF